jgi:DNA-directed RNA polymerase subunit RPC12/RpoP
MPEKEPKTYICPICGHEIEIDDEDDKHSEIECEDCGFEADEDEFEES